MRRWSAFAICVVLGLLMLGLGLLVPMHLRAVDACILKRAGRKTPTLVEQGLTLVSQEKAGPAMLLARAAKSQSLAGEESLARAVTNLISRSKGLKVWGSHEPRLDTLFGIENRPIGT